MKDIPGYEGLYAVTSCGKVWSHRRKKFLSPADNGHGYLHVNLTDAHGNIKHQRVHILVAKTYLERPEGKTDVGHLDDCRQHNWVGNLKWMTRVENLNTDHYREAAKHRQRTKVRCVETGVIYKDCADAGRDIGIHSHGINNVLLGKQKTAGGYHWERVYEENEI